MIKDICFKMPPKKKHSKARTRRNQAHTGRSVPSYAVCTECGDPVLSHRTCPSCGYYQGRVVISEDTAEISS